MRIGCCAVLLNKQHAQKVATATTASTEIHRTDITNNLKCIQNRKMNASTLYNDDVSHRYMYLYIFSLLLMCDFVRIYNIYTIIQNVFMCLMCVRVFLVLFFKHFENCCIPLSQPIKFYF